MNIKEIAAGFVGGEIREILKKVNWSEISNVTELRIRLDKPLLIKTTKKEVFINREGLFCNSEKAYRPIQKDMDMTVEMLGGYSLYAFQEEIRNGYITIPGGHRVGICGKCVVDNNKIKTIKYISALCYRINHQIKGCSDDIIKYIEKDSQVYHTLIISPPGAGKTTLLRDIARNLSLKGYSTGICDERSEIAGSYLGIPQNDIGPRSDVMDACPKALGMTMLLRSMSPDIIAVDEIGKNEDIIAFQDIINAGVKLICTAHGASLDDMIKNPQFSNILHHFKRIIVLSKNDSPGKITALYDAKFNNILGE